MSKDGPQPSVLAAINSYLSPDQQTGPYAVFSAATTYEYESGLLQGAVAKIPASPGAPPVRAKILRFAAPIGRRIFSWMISRIGKKPLLPSPDTNDSNEILESAKISPLAPEMDAAAG